MPRIFDNIERHLLPALTETLNVSYRADFCVGYFNLRGWQQLDRSVETWTGGEGAQCRLLVGMQRLPADILQEQLRSGEPERMTNQRAARLRKELAQEFRRQLTLGTPSNEDETALRRLASQIRSGRLVVKLFLRHLLHAKLYLLFRRDIAAPIIGFTGSSNLTFSGLAGQGELNLDVLEQDAAAKLAAWFEERWNDTFCVDISREIADIIEESWAGEQLTPPYYIYLKMAYHLSQEARAGLNEFTVPRRFQQTLFDFQKAAVQIAARHLNRRGGVLIGDVVGLGKTIMATAVAKIFEEDFGVSTLIICPKNLVKMWQWHRAEYGLTGDVLSLSRVQQELPHLRRYRLVLIDESHNLRNREGKRYRAIKDYIEQNESRCILLTATPYNKTYLDLSSQLRLFVPDEADLGIRPEALLRQIGEIEFNRQFNVPLRSLGAFERSPYPDDWRELMSLYMVRRTRRFIRDNYALEDPENGRRYLTFPDGRREYFPDRVPRRLDFRLDESDPTDQYARLYALDVVEAINGLHLPRYGLQNYALHRPKQSPTEEEARIIRDLARGGRRLMGFCRTNLFKRLESSGYAFLLSVERHVLRNFIFLHALENGLPLPIGAQEAEMLDTGFEDEDVEDAFFSGNSLFDWTDADNDETMQADATMDGAADPVEAYRVRAGEVYQRYRTALRTRFRWLRADLFGPSLKKHLAEDAEHLLHILHKAGRWQPNRDSQLEALYNLLTAEHPNQKVLIFSQFADTVRYLEGQLRARGVTAVAGATGKTADPTALAWRFSPVSNNKREQVAPEQELRVLIATDVLSEGQNLQDCAVVVNYDLPWAIIRLIQRAGRVDRIGQRASTILCYTLWPAEGLERIIRLRQRLRQRLTENQEVVGADEAFFEEQGDGGRLLDLYHEQVGALEADDEGEVDLVSYAYQIWKNATDANPALRTIIPRLPLVSHATKTHRADLGGPPGVLVYIKTGQGNSALAWMGEAGRSITHSQRAILDAACCSLDEPALPRGERHHELVQGGVEHLRQETAGAVGGQLGRPTGARFRTYERLIGYLDRARGTLFDGLPVIQSARAALEQIYRYPLRETAAEQLNRQLRSGIRDEDLAELVANLYDEDRLCIVHEDQHDEDVRIICSMGLSPA